MKKRITLHDKTFEEYISGERINRAIRNLARRINEDYKDVEMPLFLGVLNGAFMFMGELMKHIDFNCEVSFIKLASYAGTGSSGKVNELIGLKSDICGRHVIIVDDVVDTGESFDHLMRSLEVRRPATVEIAAMLFKPDAYRKDRPVKYAGISVSNGFIVGYGLDYNELGRNLRDI